MSAEPLTASETETHPRFATREFADTITGKDPRAYLRLHDPVQRLFVRLSEERSGSIPQWRLFADRFVHFFRELSLFELPRSGRGLDECCVLALEAAFDLATHDHAWRAEFLADGQPTTEDLRLLYGLSSRWSAYRRGHRGLCDAMTDLHAPKRERGDIDSKDEPQVIHAVEAWFRAGAAAASLVHEDEGAKSIVEQLSELSRKGWEDRRLHTHIIRTAPRLSPKATKADLLAHPVIRLAAVHHRNHPAEREITEEFLHRQCIATGWESENDYFSSDLILAGWVRDARAWAANFRRERPAELKPVFLQAGRKALLTEREFNAHRFDINLEESDDIELTKRLIEWRRKIRGTPFCCTRGEAWEVVTHCAIAGLWIGWIRSKPAHGTRPRILPASRPNA